MIDYNNSKHSFKLSYEKRYSKPFTCIHIYFGDLCMLAIDFILFMDSIKPYVYTSV